MNMVAIVSGGMDSITMLYNFQSEIRHVLNFNYGSKHNEKETYFAELHAKRLGKGFSRVEMPFIGELFQSDLLKSGGDIPEGHYEHESMKRTVVPFRNGIMLSIAVGFAESINAKSVLIGNHAGDHAIYPDCREDFISWMNGASMYGTYKHIQIISPYIKLNKTEIAGIGSMLEVPWAETYTCYKGGEKHCGKCGSCTERKEALGENDPTEYEQ